MQSRKQDVCKHPLHRCTKAEPSLSYLSRLKLLKSTEQVLMNIIMPWHILIHIPLNFYVFDITKLRFLFLAEHSYFLIFPNGAEIKNNKNKTLCTVLVTSPS